MLDKVVHIIEGFLGNPFDIAAEMSRRAKEALLSLRVATAMRHLLGAGQVEQAKLLILSVGHYRACQSHATPDQIFPVSILPRAVAARLPRSRGDYLRVVAAAGRCYRKLAGIRGSSALLQRARREAWAACFGDSLRHALDLERVIRDHDVLILGETGTGKESFAQAIQAATPGPMDGSPAPTAAINAAALPETLVESELFGHVKGAFTGASEARVGRLRSSDHGCFFLDEVGDLPTTTQVKLLRVIESNEVFPLGSDRAETVDVRYVAATHKDLEALVEKRSFRRDLFERLAGNIIRIPPLRDRPEDILEIGKSFIASYGQGIDVIERLETWLRSSQARSYSWPGNVRELQNALRNLLLGLPPGLKDYAARRDRDQRDSSPLPPAIASCNATLQTVNDWYIARVMAHADGNYSQAAKILDIDRSTVRRRTRQLEAETPSSPVK
ncbi:MAG: sigma 54-interacting transcriptional regulator [Proteobacteria bacterium]|nr:sigma 54-interacting transcriptional regulator [Pseudomonadota bacterium]